MARKTSFGLFFDDFEVKHLQIESFSGKQVSFKLKVIFSSNFRSKTKKIVRAIFEENIKVSDFGLIWRPLEIFFKNPALSLFYLYSSLTSCKKSGKSSESFLRKLRYQPTNQLTNQPIITNNTDFIGAG